MKQTNSLILPGQKKLEVFQDMNRATVLRLAGEGGVAVTMSPREACDLAVVLLKVNGVPVNVVEQPAADQGGKPMKAAIKFA